MYTAHCLISRVLSGTERGWDDTLLASDGINDPHPRQFYVNDTRVAASRILRDQLVGEVSDISLYLGIR